MGKEKSPFKFRVNSDPLMNLLFNMLRIDFFIIIFSLYIPLIVLVWNSGNLMRITLPKEFSTLSLQGKNTVPFLKDPSVYAGILVLLIFWYVWSRLSVQVSKTLRSLLEQGTVGDEKDMIPNNLERESRIIRFLANTFFWRFRKDQKLEPKSLSNFDEYIHDFENAINSKGAYMFATLFVLVQEYFFAYKPYSISVWEISTISWGDKILFPLEYYYYAIVWGFLYFLLAVLVWKLSVIVLYTRKLCRNFEIIIQPLNPDKCGGLKPIGDLCLDINLLIFFAGIGLAIYYHIAPQEISPYLLIFILGYLALSIFLFFFPLSEAHGAMKYYKDQLLDDLSKRLNLEYKKMQDQIREKGIEVNYTKLDRLEKIEKIYQKAELMPIWPFDKNTLTTFSYRVMFPVVLVIIDSVVKKLI